jgi:hypothetical protein
VARLCALDAARDGVIAMQARVIEALARSVAGLLEGWPLRGVEHVGGHVGEDDAPDGQLVQV